jgi:hypothetical protein
LKDADVWRRTEGADADCGTMRRTTLSAAESVDCMYLSVWVCICAGVYIVYASDRRDELIQHSAYIRSNSGHRRASSSSVSS